jgi:hypothetical protein
MKPKLYFPIILLALISGNLRAQIPNSGFENWITAGNCEEAAGWYTTNLIDTNGTFCPVSRSTDHFPAVVGSYSIRLENNAALLPNLNAYGIATTTLLDGSDKPLFPISGHPDSLCGYFKFDCINQDTMSLNVYLSYNSIEIASGHFLVDSSVTNWTPFTIPISSYANADSARITLMAANIKGAGVQGNSVLYVDNLSFDTLIADRLPEVPAPSAISISPNPASETITVSFPASTGPLTEIFLYDISGRTVYKLEASCHSSPLRLDVSDLDEGMYFLSLGSEKGIVADQKLVIER